MQSTVSGHLSNRQSPEQFQSGSDLAVSRPRSSQCLVKSEVTSTLSDRIGDFWWQWGLVFRLVHACTLFFYCRPTCKAFTAQDDTFLPLRSPCTALPVVYAKSTLNKLGCSFDYGLAIEYWRGQILGRSLGLTTLCKSRRFGEGSYSPGSSPWVVRAASWGWLTA